MTYTGRFAPSPSGPLHFGSLVAALASYLDAKHHQGTWLVRMEDIDPPREQPGAAELILKTLKIYGLHWDGDVLFQSQRSTAYQRILDDLLSQKALYPCDCTRKQLAGSQGVYPGYCRNKVTEVHPPYALRLRCSDQQLTFNDRIQGNQSYSLGELGDFVLKRKDGLFAYQLAVCIDDQAQGVTHIVRGVDLLDSTPRQLYLQNVLGYHSPLYAHIPVITLNDGNKLSKQNHAPALPLDDPRPLLINALLALGMKPPAALANQPKEILLQWAIDKWNIRSIKTTHTLPLESLSTL